MSAMKDLNPEAGRWSVRAHWEIFVSRVREADILVVVPFLSFCLIIFHGFKDYHAAYYEPFIAFVALPALFYKPLLRNPLFWLGVAAVSGLVVFRLWFPIDNHKFLLFYWALVLACAFAARDEEDQRWIIIKSARFFMVLVFAGAAFQKFTEPSYMDSSFFEFTLLTDIRFETFMAFLGVDRADLAFNREVFFEGVQRGHLLGAGGAAVLRTSEHVNLIAFLVTWWDVLVQFAMAVAFAIATRRADQIGHILLLIFIVTTYFPAPVIGFGWSIAILGYAMTAHRMPAIAMCYLASFMLLTVYDLPWNLYFQQMAGFG